ncbi:HAD family hydrolase [Lachnoclostridium pacaense]|uniref:HAD family hydrolase n=1 Tax=Enterocloster hominis (ex Hitch et al. 2024) TaxID=1917870 RepID=UPI001D10D84A|nr:HAD family hydrolase [Lachnoclostridium pacaense]MCC2819584.1 HAD family hydrolase [Lachnoclostridium pacaense]
MEPSRKLVFIDLDGTLLDDSRRISAYSLDTIHRLRQSGSLPCIASGRPASMVRLYTHELMLDTPLITNNAANISHSGNLLRQTCLPPAAAWEFLDYCFYHHMDWAVFYTDTIYTADTPTRLMRYRDYNQRLEQAGFPPVPVTVVRSKDQAKALLSSGAERLSLLVHSLTQQQLILSYFEHACGLSCIRSTPDSFDIVHPAVDKWSGVQFIADYYGIPLSRVYVFGNDRNDLKMIRNCPNSFAVSNGEPEVLKSAAHVIGKNSEDGVAKAIEKYLLS